MLRVFLPHERFSAIGPYTLSGDRLVEDAHLSLPHVIRQSDVSASPEVQGWIGRRLHEAYDPIAAEPLPTDLDALLSRLDGAA